jgi:hypothetical protein
LKCAPAPNPSATAPAGRLAFSPSPRAVLTAFYHANTTSGLCGAPWTPLAIGLACDLHITHGSMTRPGSFRRPELLQNLLRTTVFTLDETFASRYGLDQMQRRLARNVPRLLNALPDDLAARQLQISRMTLFRKLKDGTISAPAPVPGTRRRWWRLADIETAREQLNSLRRGSAS